MSDVSPGLNELGSLDRNHSAIKKFRSALLSSLIRFRLSELFLLIIAVTGQQGVSLDGSGLTATCHAFCDCWLIS